MKRRLVKTWMVNYSIIHRSSVIKDKPTEALRTRGLPTLLLAAILKRKENISISYEV